MRSNFGLAEPLTLGVFVGGEFDADARARSDLGVDGLAARATLNWSW